MGKPTQWMSPCLKQCFVTSGVSLNMASAGLVMGFTSGLLQQLMRPDSEIPIDKDSGSWIAAIPGFSLILGNIIVPTIMAKYGRKKANIVSIVPLLTGWTCIILAKDIPLLLIARFLQGISMGMSALISSTLIGEYTSPKNRGAFLMTISISIALAVLSVHTMGSYLSWQLTAVICGVIAAIDLLIVIGSPESPSWLADQGRYEECKKVFRWLRGDNEEEELKRMIESSMIVKEAKADVNINQSIMKKINSNIVYFSTTIRKKEFYKPIFIMMHIYTIGQWSGINLLVAYPNELFNEIVGPDANIPLLVITVDAHRLIANILAMYIVKKIKRRTMLFTTVSINIFGLFATAAYTFLKGREEFNIDYPLIGIVLIHTIMFAIATGTLSLCFIIAGEIFPLEYRSLAGGISVIFLSLHLFVTVKTVAFFFSTLGLHGAFCLYAFVLIYCLLITWLFLPETKDRTLQDIEDEFRGRPLSPEELKSVQSLTSWKSAHADRRCSTPVVL